MSFKYFVDVLSSVASLVAIVSVLIAWYRSRLKPLKLKRVLVHKKKTSTTFFLYVINRQAYPVKIRNLKCFTKVTFQVSQKNNCRPERLQKLDYDDLVFQTQDEYEVEAYADCSIKIEYDEPIAVESDKLVVSTQTSHGYHLLKVRDIDIVHMGTGSVGYLVPFEETFDSKIKARVYHVFAIVRFYIRKLFKKES
ncbi:hypothetical protein D5E85_26675 [Vibrio parahaemolyticus]|nr:hypothetical protein [Vibrio parahaemolyticus]TBT25996.1 hypothetical protein D5E85_26675 [Vibrio parahaemolyticus]